MIKPSNIKEIRRYSLLFAAVYMISYITRVNYGAIISEMELSTGYARSLLSVSLTGSFITYGIGQVVSGVCGDKFSPKKLVLLGLSVTVAMNALLPFCNNPYIMIAVWCVNGFAQSFMWPPLVRLMTELFSEKDYKKGATLVSMGGSIGTILVYLISPLIIAAFSWKAVFIFSALCGLVMIFVWQKYCCELEVSSAKCEKKEHSHAAASQILVGGLMLPIILAIVFQGMLKDGVTTWMPSYISETYEISNLISILSGVILPVFGIICVQAASKIYIKYLKNPLICAGAFFFGAALSAGALCLFNGKNSMLSVVLSALLTGCIHGVNFILTSMLPPFFKKYGNVSTVSGLLNACTYIGSAVSTYGIALLSENSGWGVTLITWLIIALAGAVISFLCGRPWKNKMMD